jgi:serine/threonine-protein kinase
MIRAGFMAAEQIIGRAVSWPLGDVHVRQEVRAGQAVDVVILPTDAATGAADELLAGMRAVLGFRHPGFVDLLECDRLDDGTVHLVREHVEAESLSERLQRDGGLVPDLNTIRQVAVQIAAALGAVHGAGFLYLCLRPEPVLLVPASQPGLQVTVRLLELGLGNHFLSRIRQMAPGKELPASILRYSPPEECSGGEVDRRSDIYALGCVLFELLVGRPPFQNTDIWDLVSAHAHELPPRIRELRPELPPALDDLVATMLEKDPARRPFCMEEIVAVLRTALPEPAAVPASEETPPSAAIPRTVLLDEGPAVPNLAAGVPATPAFRPTRVLTTNVEGRVPRRPAAVASRRRARRDPLPASVEAAPARRRSAPSKGRRGKARSWKPSHTAMFVGLTLACAALGAGLFLWFLRPTAGEAQRSPIEEAPAREVPIPPAAASTPIPAAIATPTPAGPLPTVGLVPPKPEAIEKHPLGLGRKHVPSRRVQAPDVPLFPQSPDGVIKPTYRRR